MLKFQVKDKIRRFNDKATHTVIAIVFGPEQIGGNWLNGWAKVEVENSYILECNSLCQLSFASQDKWILVERPKAQIQVQIQVNNCPRCGKELFDKISEYTGTVVKKCKCGWC